jgi:hypothetical protein
MGERLVVEIKRNDRPIASIYYHWSAYTRPAVNIVHSMYKHVLAESATMTDQQLQLALIRFAENTVAYGYIGESKEGATVRAMIEQAIEDADDSAKEMLTNMLTSHGGICLEDRDLASKLFPDETFAKDISRNEGLVAISEQSMLDNQRWAEGMVLIDLSANTVLNGLAYEYDVKDYLYECEDRNEDCFTDPDDLTKIPINIADFKLDEIEIVKDVLDINEDETWLRFEDKIFEIISG